MSAKSRTDRLGRNLERLVSVIEKAIHDASNIDVEARKRLVDKDTGRLREHDVVLTITQNHFPIIVAIECRDRQAKIGSPDVEQFYFKCQRTGVNKAIMVSASGFATPALKKATNWGIECLSLNEVEAFDWCQAITVDYGERNLINQHPWEVETANSIDPLPDIRGSDGKPLSIEKMSELAHQYLAMRPIDLAHAQDTQARQYAVTCKVVIPMPPDLYVMAKQGELVPIARLTAYVTYEIASQPIPLEFHEYRNEVTGEAITNAAVGKLDGAAGKAEFVLQRKPDGTYFAMVIPEQQ